MNNIDLTFWLNQVPAELAQDRFALKVWLIIAGIGALCSVDAVRREKA